MIHEPLATSVVSETAPVQASNEATFSITLYEYQGRAHIKWNETFGAPVGLAVALYNNKQPANPENWLGAYDLNGQSSGTWDSGVIWGSGYSASMLGGGANRWEYIGVDTPVT
ncbi:MAG: hypothetical protein E8D43_00725 [Nitrospira sp.]|nr:MAG: hypothetical protein E8D43_00725 [Nitrospira sp.]